MKNSKFNILFEQIMQEFSNNTDPNGQEQIQEYDTHCMACNELFCLDSAIEDKQNNCYRCPYCGSDKLEDNIQ